MYVRINIREPQKWEALGSRHLGVGAWLIQALPQVSPHQIW